MNHNITVEQLNEIARSAFNKEGNTGYDTLNFHMAYDKINDINRYFLKLNFEYTVANIEYEIMVVFINDNFVHISLGKDARWIFGIGELNHLAAIRKMVQLGIVLI